MKKLLETVKHNLIIYMRVWQRKNEGIRIFRVDPYAPGRIIVSKNELKRQEQYILDNKLNEEEAYEYRRNEVFSYCNSIKKRNRYII